MVFLFFHIKAKGKGKKQGYASNGAVQVLATTTVKAAPPQPGQPGTGMGQAVTSVAVRLPKSVEDSLPPLAAAKQTTKKAAPEEDDGWDTASEGGEGGGKEAVNT